MLVMYILKLMAIASYTSLYWEIASYIVITNEIHACMFLLHDDALRRQNLASRGQMVAS